VLPENSRSCNGDSVNIEGIVEETAPLAAQYAGGEDPPDAARVGFPQGAGFGGGLVTDSLSSVTRVGVGCENAGRRCQDATLEQVQR